MMKNTEISDYDCFSYDDEAYFDDYDGVLNEANNFAILNGDDTFTIWAGVKKYFTHSDMLKNYDISGLIECMQSMAYELSPEFSDGYLQDLDQSSGLQDDLRKHILQWLTDNNIEPPKFWCPEDVTELIYRTENDDI